MHDLVLMRVLEGVTQLGHERPKIFPTKMMTGLLQPQAAKILTVNEFKRDKRRFTGGLNKIVNADDVGMVQPAALLHFTLKIVECGRIASEFLGQSLDGQLLAGLLIHGQPYFAPSAPSQLAL